MTRETMFYQVILIMSFIFAAGTFAALFFISAPYGRHTRRGWGPKIPNWMGWLLMESVSAVFFLVLFIIGTAPRSAATVIFLIMWEAHYLHRSYIYPFMLRDGRKKMPLVIPLMAVVFNMSNAYLNGRYLFHFSGDRYTTSWLLHPRFLIGALVFITGFSLNRWADDTLRQLREPGESGYKIPQGGMYRYISCPNYFGEILEWTGWAIATWSLPGLAFAVWTFANLAPRAQAHHRWYHEEFVDYPPERKALIPGVW